MVVSEIFFQVRTWEESKGCVVITTCSNKGRAFVPKKREAIPDINGVDSKTAAKVKDFLSGAPDLPSMKGAESTATSLAAQPIALQAHKPAGNQKQVPTPLHVSAEKTKVRAALEIVVDKKIRGRKGNGKYSADATKTATNKIFQNLVEGAGNHLKNPKLIKGWKEPPSYRKSILSALKARTQELIDVMSKLEGLCFEKGLSSKVAHRLVHEALMKVAAL